MAGRASSAPHGWRVLRDQWQDYRHKDPASILQLDATGNSRTGRFKLELGGVDKSVRVPRCGAALSKDAADRAMEMIISQFSEELPTEAAQMKSWVKARDAHNEMRATLADLGLKHIETPPAEGDPPAPADAEAMSLFPKAWYSLVNEELLADLVVDAFTGAFVDAFVDGAVALAQTQMIERANALEEQKTIENVQMQATAASSSTALMGRTAPSRFAESASEPDLLPNPRAFRPLSNPFRAMPPAEPKGGPNTHAVDTTMQRSASFSSTTGKRGKEGFPMRGLPHDSHAAWTVTRSFHECKPVEKYTSRIQRATRVQRPQRRLDRPSTHDPTDQRKYVWPTTKTHLPDLWEETTRKKRVGVGVGRARAHAILEPAVEPTAQGNGLIGVDENGKTTFPYSLVLHKAFLDSQQTEDLREKARQAVPFRLTTSMDTSWN